MNKFKLRNARVRLPPTPIAYTIDIPRNQWTVVPLTLGLKPYYNVTEKLRISLNENPPASASFYVYYPITQRYVTLEWQYQSFMTPPMWLGVRKVVPTGYVAFVYSTRSISVSVS